MNAAEQSRYKSLYQQHLRALKLQGMSHKTIDAYARALRSMWSRHRNPQWLFPNALGSPERIARTSGPMDRGGAQAAMKAVVQSCGIKKKSRFIHCATATPPTCWNKV